MDAAILPAISGLVGSLIGALSSLAGSWLNQRSQLRSQLWLQDAAKREALYVDFINETSKHLAEAVTHQTEDPVIIVGLYSAVERMRLVSSREVVHTAEDLVREIVKAYEAPNLTFEQLLDHDPAYRFTLVDGCHHDRAGSCPQGEAPSCKLRQNP